MSNTKANRQSPKTAIITGASKRIGAAIARSLAMQGVNLIVHYLGSTEDAKALCQDLEVHHNVRAVPIKADLTDGADTKRLFEESVKALGPIELLVNNASIFEPDSLLEPINELWAAHFAIHLQAPSILSAEMAKQENLDAGLIVNIIDQRVQNLNPTFYSYTLSKSALWTATKTMAQSLGPKIRVNGIGPGPTLPNKRQSEADFDKQVRQLLLKEAPDLAEFGETIAWMWKTQSVTGQLVMLDGGQHLAWETPDVNGIKE